MKKIYLAGGCFWGIEAYFQKIKGVIDTDVYYLNGGFEGVTYKEVCNSSSHVEAVKIIYDENLIKNKDIWEIFVDLINPFSINQQGNDRGIQYRSGIYSENLEDLEDFKKLNSLYEEKLNKKTAIEFQKITDKTRAEEYHQDYLIKNPSGYCHIDLFDIKEKYIK